MAAQNDYKFQGWLALDPESVNGKMEWQTFEPKTWEETDVDIKVTHCGICGSDIHTLRSGWVSGPISLYQCLAVVLTLQRDLLCTLAVWVMKSWERRSKLEARWRMASSERISKLSPAAWDKSLKI